MIGTRAPRTEGAALLVRVSKRLRPPAPGQPASPCASETKQLQTSDDQRKCDGEVDRDLDTGLRQAAARWFRDGARKHREADAASGVAAEPGAGEHDG